MKRHIWEGIRQFLRLYIEIWNRGQFLQKKSTNFYVRINIWVKQGLKTYFKKPVFGVILPTILLLINSVLVLGACTGYWYSSKCIQKSIFEFQNLFFHLLSVHRLISFKSTLLEQRGPGNCCYVSSTYVHVAAVLGSQNAHCAQ